MKDQIIKKISLLLQEISDEHGVQVDRFYANWIDVSTMAEQKHILGRVSIDINVNFPLSGVLKKG